MRIGIITGCGKGIGLAACKTLMDKDPDLKLFGITRTKNSNLQKLESDYPERFVCFYSDVDLDESHLLLDDIVLEYRRIDFLVLNAGIRSRLPLSEASIEDFKRVASVNTFSQIRFSQHLAKLARQHNFSANILVVSSIVGAHGFDALSTYGVSKSALDGFVRCAAVEWGKSSIRINALAPGFVSSSYARDFKESKPALYKWT